MVILYILTDETVVLFYINKLCGGSPEDTLKVSALGCGLPYKKVKVYSTMVDSPKYNV